MIKLEKEARKVVSVLDPDSPTGARAVEVDTFMIGRRIIDDHANVLEVRPLYGTFVKGVFVLYVEPGARSIFGPPIFIQDIDTKKDFSELLEKVKAKGAPMGEFRKADIEDFLIEKGLIKGTKT